jgi:hypothetical protein
VQVRRRFICLCLALLLLGMEVIIATGLRRLHFVRGSLGDVLVVMLVYCTALAVRDFERVRLAIGVFLFACAIEASQYFHLASRLRLRPGSVLAIALGNSFAWGDILCYLMGCALILAADMLVRRRRPG